MKHKWLAILVLGAMMLVSFPTHALAAEKDQEKALHATMTNLVIGQGTVTPIPKNATGKDIKAWNVKDRPFMAMISGDINGTIVLTTSGIMSPEQSGIMGGPFTIDSGVQGDGKDLITGKDVIILKGGTPQPVALAVLTQNYGLWYIPYMPDFSSMTSFATLPVATNGVMEMQKGTDSYAGFHAEAKFSGTVTTAIAYYPDGTNHVIGILPGQSLTLTGKQKMKN